MQDNNHSFKVGKLNHQYLGGLLKKFVKSTELNDDRVILGSTVGEDAAVIDMGERYMVMKTDPITFATDEIGYYAVNVNVNDVVCTGAEPKWFQSTILLPEKRTSEALIENIFKSIHDTCKDMNISVVGGHTEVTSGIERPIVIGSLIGEVEKDQLVTTSGAKAGDAIVLTKGIFIEGTSIIAREKEDYLIKEGFSQEFIEKCKNYLYSPGISVYKEALLANKNFSIHAMHDPTEGGLACGLAEMALASKNGILIDKGHIEILPEPKKLSKLFKIDPLNTISSGSLLIAISDDQAQELISFLKNNDIIASKIGNFTEFPNTFKLIDKEGNEDSLDYSETDEITKIFK